MPRVAQYDGGHLSVVVPATIFDRLEKVAPTAQGRRSAFIRDAIAAALERAERQTEQDRDHAPATV